MPHAHDLTDEAIKSRMGAIAARLASGNADHLRYVYEQLSELFDTMDEDDGFGTEGWKYWFGVEG